MSEHSSTTHPFSRLTPERVLAAIDSCGFETDGRLLALNSYENRVYQAGTGEAGFVVAKFYRPERWSDAAILEEHAFTKMLAEREVPAVPPCELRGGSTLHFHEGFRVAVFPRRGGRSPELDVPGHREWLGRFIARIHAVGSIQGFLQRQTLDVATFGIAAGECVSDSIYLPDDLREAYRASLKSVLDGIRACFEDAGDFHRIRLHGDCHLGNVLWTDMGPHFVDFDDSCMGPAIQDLWMLLSGDRVEMTAQLLDLIEGYEQFAEFDPREVGLIEALRSLRMIHHAAWLAKRWEDPAFPAAFPWFNMRSWWEEHIRNLCDQVPRMAERWVF